MNMLQITANFNSDIAVTKRVSKVTRTGTLVLDDAHYVSNKTLEIIMEYPEIILREKSVTGRQGDNLLFWE